MEIIKSCVYLLGIWNLCLAQAPDDPNSISNYTNGTSASDHLVAGTNIPLELGNNGSASFWYINQNQSRFDMKEIDEFFRTSFVGLFNDFSFGGERRIHLAGSYIPYIGHVRVPISENRWGAICGDGWDVNDATVVCRQMGFQIGIVIAKPRNEFNHPIGDIILSQVNCAGNESSLDECEAERRNGSHPVPCQQGLRGAGVICGCPDDVPNNVHSNCSFSTKFFVDSFSCRYSCSRGYVLLGDEMRSCTIDQTWSGIPPQCIEIDPTNQRPSCRLPLHNQFSCNRNHEEAFPNNAIGATREAEICISQGCCYNRSMPEEMRCFFPIESPCVEAPCLNGGVCRDEYRDGNYECDCPSMFEGINCEISINDTCGYPPISPNTGTPLVQLRIVGGTVANRGSWPWVVQIRERDVNFCSGTLVSSLWVITAAHCLDSRKIPTGHIYDSRWTVVTGQHRRTGHDLTSQTLRVVYAISHNFTNVDIPRNDVALLKLGDPVYVDNFTSPICLPFSINEQPIPGSNCWIAGWGQTSASIQTSSRFLQQGAIPILSMSDCRINNDPNHNYHLVDENMICAGYENGGVDACGGDSGGPLMCSREDGSWFLAGIVSWGYGCAEANTPGVYTRVSHYNNWIYNILDNF